MNHDLDTSPAGRIGAWRGTATGILLFLAIMLAVDLLLLHGAGWSPIFWGKDRPRVPAIGFAAVMLAAFAMCERRIMPRFTDRGAKIGLALAMAASAVLSLLVAFVVLRCFPNSGDEYAYWFGGQTYLTGHLWNAAPPLGQAMASNYTWVAGTKWAGQYPPGWPGMIAGATAIGLSPWILGTLLAGGTTYGLHDMIRRDAGRVAAALGAAAFALAPFTLFTAGSLHSHGMAAALAVAILVAATRISGSRSPGWALLTGALMGALGVTRSVTAVAVILPVAGMLVLRRDFRSLILIGLGGAPFVALLLWYQGTITGDPLKPVYWLAGRNVDHLYFDLPSIKKGLVQTVNRLAGLLLWTSPVLPLLWLFAFFGKARSRTLRPADFVFPIGVAIFAFYPLHAGNGYGPRYYFDFWPLLIYTVASALSGQAPATRRRIEALLILSIVYALAIWPVLASDFRRISAERRDLYEQAAERRIRNGVICVRSGTGAMLDMGPSDLVRNGVDAQGPVLYARCDMVTLPALAAAFPDRSVWVYDRNPSAVRGHLTRIR